MSAKSKANEETRRSKRKGAREVLTKVHNRLGIDMFVLCSFAFARTTIYTMLQTGDFIARLRKDIRGPLDSISEHFRGVVKEVEKESPFLLELNVSKSPSAGHGQGRAKRRQDDPGMADNEREVQRIRRETPKLPNSGIVGASDPSNSAPPISPSESTPETAPQQRDGGLGGKVYDLSFKSTMQFLAFTRESVLYARLTVPDSNLAPFVTFSIDPGDALRYLTEPDQGSGWHF
ncbi:hypothetical protein CGMCC3_g17970 [Colletotrichum fructicola]|nr:uncharacterized protein CGMCC3_g17970 [Colletotrichum fructicola]KAE9565852.1 hypothetical protein CGMCC3_g17970 [Colletotrichum fructicola]